MLNVRMPAMLLLAAFLIFSSSRAGEGEGFQSLFNGKDLSGWVIENGEAGEITVVDAGISFSPETNEPTWLRTAEEYENFELVFDYYLRKGCLAGLLLHAPLHGDQTWGGFQVRLNCYRGAEMNLATGSLFPVTTALTVAGRTYDQWNTCRVVMDWPALRVTINDTLVQDCNLDSDEELRYRLKQGHIGFKTIGHGVIFKNIRIKELPSKSKWISLFNGEDLSGWKKIGSAKWEVRPGGVLHARDGDGYLISKDKFQDFEFRAYIRTKRVANGGVFFRWIKRENNDRGYEVQIENLQDSKNPTGSLYHYVRANRPRVRPEEWFLMQVMMKGSRCVVRINGETLVDYDKLTKIRRGYVALQMHRRDSWVEFKDIRINPLD